MRAVFAPSTFRPPPFVSLSRGTVYALPQHVLLPSHHRTSHHRVPYHVPPPIAHNDSFLMSAGGISNDNSMGETYVVWNLADANVTTPASVTSPLTSEKPHYPAGYPSGYSWPHIVCASVIITVVILIIVVGNFLVMWAIVRDKNLKGTQNYFIGSLALADFLLGLLIVPFSLANELMGYWYFGAVFCEVWKAVDVLLCTASITSLCLISLDRYWSITKAIHYSRQRTPKRAAVMIFIVWFVSAAICIPPLIGWNQPVPDSDWPTCILSEDIGYVLYSSMGSFYIPAFIMVFVYFKIYQAAKARARKNVTKIPRVAQSEKSEQRNSTESSGNEHQHHPQQMQHQVRLQSDSSVSNAGTVMQTESQYVPAEQWSPVWQQPARGSDAAHLRTAVTSRCQQCAANQAALDDESPPPPHPHPYPQPHPHHPLRGELDFRSQSLDFRSRSVSLPCRTVVSNELTKLLVSTDSDSSEALTSGALLNRGGMERSRSYFYHLPAAAATTTTDTDTSEEVLYVQGSPRKSDSSYNNTTTPATAEVLMVVPPQKASSPGVKVTLKDTVVAQQDNGTVHHFTIVEPRHNGSAKKGTAVSKRDEDGGLLGSLRRQWLQQSNGKLEDDKRKYGAKKKGPKKVGRGEDFSSAERHKRKVAKARERRATLVLGLVMAAFILCWLPFFLLYVVSAFCEGCIPLMVFTVFFWIGYCNSALNPIIYTVFNRDFRRAFHRILFPRRQTWR
ncbi:hypothetical protein ACOMHN_063041 [Nucella lapillus]